MLAFPSCHAWHKKSHLPASCPQVLYLLGHLYLRRLLANPPNSRTLVFEAPPYIPPVTMDQFMFRPFPSSFCLKNLAVITSRAFPLKINPQSDSIHETMRNWFLRYPILSFFLPLVSEIHLSLKLQCLWLVKGASVYWSWPLRFIRRPQLSWRRHQAFRNMSGVLLLGIFCECSPYLSRLLEA